MTGAEIVRCARCRKVLGLKARVVYLELNSRTGRYCEPGTVPPEESQGGFPLGMDCARVYGWPTWEGDK